MKLLSSYCIMNTKLRLTATLSELKGTHKIMWDRSFPGYGFWRGIMKVGLYRIAQWIIFSFFFFFQPGGNSRGETSYRTSNVLIKLSRLGASMCYTISGRTNYHFLAPIKNYFSAGISLPCSAGGLWQVGQGHGQAYLWRALMGMVKQVR